MPYGSDPTEVPQQPRVPGSGLSVTPSPAQGRDVPPESALLYPKVRQAEGTAKGSGFLTYGGEPFTPGSEHPGEAARRRAPDGRVTHAAGPGQWEPGTWDGLKPDFEKLMGRPPVFSDDDDQRRMVWLNAEKIYGPRLAEDLREGKLNTGKLAGQWSGFAGGGAGGYGKDPVIGAGNWSVDPKAIEAEQSRNGTSVVWMAPAEYLQMVPTLEAGRIRSKTLDRSVASGEQIEAIPFLDVKRDGDQYKVIDQDGRKRAVVAKEAGVDLIPVAVRGAIGEGKQLVGMTGNTVPFDFKPVPKVEKLPEKGFRRYLSESLDALGDGARELPGAVRDVGTGLLGLGERAEIAEETAAGAPGREPALPLEGLERIGDAATFLTGGLTGPIAPEMQAARAAASGPLPAMLADRPPVSAPANMMSPAGNAFMQDLRGVTQQENAARDIINRRFGQDLKAGGATGQQMAADMAAGAREGQPLTLADVGGENMRSLLGNVAREPGPARNRVKQWAINRLGDIDRDSPIAAAISDGISKLLATGSARTEARILAEQRSASKPLWDEAMAGGSIAPLRQQFETAYADADRAVREAERDIARINQEVTGAAGRQSQAGNVYSTSAANRARRFADDKIAEKQKALEQVERDKAEIREKMQQAQKDDMSNAPGAVWSPYLGRLLKNPKIAEGIRRGWNIERDIADGENRLFNPREYAVVGEDANGPVIGTVPNMKLLAVAKEGLDAMLDSPAFKDELTGRLNKAGRALKILRDGMVTEVDRINPAYKVARDAWAGDSALISNIRDGKNFHKQSPEEIMEHFAGASESEKRAYRIGAADTLRDDLERAVFNGDPSKAIINNPRSRKQLLPMFPTVEGATQFLDRVKRARQMFATPVEVLRGSPTAAREAEDLARRQGVDTAADVIGGIASMAHHSPAGMMNALARLSRNVVSPADPALNDTIARLMLDPSVPLSTNPGMDLLRKAPLPAVQNMLARQAQRVGRQFTSPGGLR